MLFQRVLKPVLLELVRLVVKISQWIDEVPSPSKCAVLSMIMAYVVAPGIEVGVKWSIPMPENDAAGRDSFSIFVVRTTLKNWLRVFLGDIVPFTICIISVSCMYTILWGSLPRGRIQFSQFMGLFLLHLSLCALHQFVEWAPTVTTGAHLGNQVQEKVLMWIYGLYYHMNMVVFGLLSIGLALQAGRYILERVPTPRSSILRGLRS